MSDIDDLLTETESKGDISFERKMTINAIMHSDYMKGIKPLLTDLSLIESPMCRTILGWCVAYYNKYGVAMKETITDVYKDQRGKLSKTLSKDISDFLESISKQYAEGHTLYNPQLEIDLTEAYIDEQSVLKLRDSIDIAMLTKNTTKAKQHVNNYNQRKQAPGAAVDGTEDFSRYHREKIKEDVLFEFPKPFNELFGPARAKHLGAICGKPKTGKSRAMAYVAAQALKNGLSVFIASLEMDEDSFMNLIDLEMIRADQAGGEGHIPYFKGTGAGTSVAFKKIERDPMTSDELENKWKAEKLFNPTQRIFVKEWGQLECSVEDDLIPQLDYIRESEGVNIQVVIVDYADLLKPNKGDERADQRIKIGNQWKSLKKMAQTRNLFCFTGSQLNRDNLLSESATKEQDANYFVRLECNPMEKRLGLYRQYVMFHRNIEYDPSRALITTSNNGIGLFNLDGRWSSDDWSHIPDDVDLDNFYLWRKNHGNEWRRFEERSPDDYG